MTTPELRPHYERLVPTDVETVIAALKTRFSASEGDIQMEFRHRHVQVSFDPNLVKWWSPWLTFDVVPDGEQSKLAGRFGSNPSFFTLWVAGLAISLILSLALSVFGYAQFVAKQTPTALYGFVISTVACLVLAGVPLLGQARAQRQMKQMNDAIEAALPS